MYIFQLLVALLVQLERLRGVITSGLLFVFWLLMTIGGIIPFYTLIIKKVKCLHHWIIFVAQDKLTINEPRPVISNNVAFWQV